MSRYQHEKNWLRAVVSALASGNTGVATAEIQYGLSSVTATTPRISVRAVGASRGSEQQWATKEYNHWQLDVEVEVVTRRTDASQNHAAIVAAARWPFENASQQLISPTVTYYQLLEAWPSGSNRVVDADQREDSTTINYRLSYALL